MKAPQPVDLATIVRTFEAIPELKSAGALAGANALHHEHLENCLGRFSFDIDLQNQAEEIATVNGRFSSTTRQRLRLISRLNAAFTNTRLASDSGLFAWRSPGLT